MIKFHARSQGDLVTKPYRSPEQPRSPQPSYRLTGLLRGTGLLTPHGYRPVETLRRGDIVGALIGRGPMFVRIAWVGCRRTEVNRDNPVFSGGAVRIRRHAIADDMPNRDVLLAPDHALYLDGRLFLAGQLVNRASILFESHRRSAEFWGIRLERHDILLADNLPVESLLPASATAFAEVSRPPLSVVGSVPPAEAAADGMGSVDFPARIRMSARWFRRRLLARKSAGVADLPTETGSEPSSPDERLHLAAELRRIVALYAAIAKQRGVQIEFAVDPTLSLRIDRTRLHDLVGAMLTHALRAVHGGRVLLGAMRHGDMVQIAVIDENGNANQVIQQADLRQAMSWAAMLGGTLEVDARPGEGTTLLARLAE